MANHLTSRPRVKAVSRLCPGCGGPLFSLRPIDYDRPEYCSMRCRVQHEPLDAVARDVAESQTDDEEDGDA